ncbi:MnhB domain-containing protein [Aquipuribacter nitratireducens]|uniref:MnhB domain-containing protein n=1 Tax=Aquipuribacter nitratireducens TaxID=650104 RepID=A0ABW0GRR0_9MICO
MSPPSAGRDVGAGGVPRQEALPGAQEQDPAQRSLLLEVVTRAVHVSMVVVAVHLLLVGLHRPGGGFAAGLLLGLGLVLRRLAGGRHDLGAAVRVPAGVLLGAGLALAAGYAAVGVLATGAPLTGVSGEWHVPGLGTLPVSSSLLLEVGIVLVVVGLVTDVLRTLGGEE